jgi:hypothetical protein
MDLKKESFPETVGMKYEKAKAIILEYNPDLAVLRHNKGEKVTMDLRRNRVRVTVDTNDVVVQAPQRG